MIYRFTILTFEEKKHILKELLKDRFLFLNIYKLNDLVTLGLKPVKVNNFIINNFSKEIKHIFLLFHKCNICNKYYNTMTIIFRCSNKSNIMTIYPIYNISNILKYWIQIDVYFK